MAITTDVGICNLALTRVGISTIITALADPTKEARACNLVYTLVRDRLLKAAPWAFCTLQAALDEDVSASGYDPNFSYAYTLPANHLKTWGIEPLASKFKWKHGLDDTNAVKVLYCDVAPVLDGATPTEPIVKYTSSAPAVTAYTSEFIDALAWALAAEIAAPLRADVKLVQLLPLRAKFALEEAMAAEFNEKQPADEPDASYINARN